MKIDDKLKKRYVSLTHRHEKMLRKQGDIEGAYTCAEIRRAISAVRLPKEEADGARKEVCDGGAK